MGFSPVSKVREALRAANLLRPFIDAVQANEDASAMALLEPEIERWVRELGSIFGYEVACSKLQDSFVLSLVDEGLQAECEKAFALRVDPVEGAERRLHKTFALIVSWTEGTPYLQQMDSRIARWRAAAT